MKFRKSIDFLLRYSFLVVTVGIFLLCVLGANYINYAYKLDIVKNNIYIYLLTLIAVVFFVYIVKKNSIYKFFISNRKIKLIFISVILFLVQVIIIYTYYFRTGWDVEAIINKAYSLGVGEEDKYFFTSYFSYYPNNIFITIVFSKILWFVNMVGVGKYSYFSLLIIQSLINILTGGLIFIVVARVTKKVYLAWSGYSLYIILIWLSPWTSIPYSDSMGLVYPILIYYLYISLDNKRFELMKLIFIGVFSVCGYFIKPQTFIITIAIIIINCFYIKKIYIKTLIRKSVIIAISMFVCFLGIKEINSDERLSLDKELEISYYHFINMGLNDVTDGGYLDDDATISMWELNKEKRKEDNVNAIRSRLKNYGFLGLVKHQVKKTLNNYNDGTFGWGLEGNFYYSVDKKDNSKLAKITRSIYYEDGSYHVYYKYLMQGIWLLILSILPLNIFRRNEPLDNYSKVIYLSLIGLFLFESIFEARSRYLYTYVPIFIVGAMLGIDGVLDCKNNFIKNSN